jgi:hypothetical protein
MHACTASRLLQERERGCYNETALPLLFSLAISDRRQRLVWGPMRPWRLRPYKPRSAFVTPMSETVSSIFMTPASWMLTRAMRPRLN